MADILLEEAKEAVDLALNMHANEPVHIEVTATDKCNCACEYCFEQDHCSDNMSEDKQNKIISLLQEYCEHFRIDKHPGLYLSFWGGEPFLNFDFIDRVLNTTAKYKFVNWHIYTNGLVTSAIDKLVSAPYFEEVKNRLDVQFSYDGEPHNTLKRKHDGKTTIANAKKLAEHGVQVRFKATLSYDMIDKLPQIWESYSELHDEMACYEYADTQYAPTIDMMSNDISYFNAWKKAIVEVAKKERKFIIKHGYPLMSWFSNNAKRSCATSSSVHLHSDGKMYICHACPYVVDKQAFSYGSYMELSSLEEVVKTTYSPPSQICQQCGATYCAVCHVQNLKRSSVSENLAEWNLVKPTNIARCKYYTYFGFVYYALKHSLIKSK